MACQRCPRAPLPEDAEPAAVEGAEPAAVEGVCDGHPPTALETLRQALHARSIQSAQAASEDSAASPIRAAWIIS